MSPTPYRLSIALDLEPFRPEIEHAMLFVERCYGLVRTSDAGAVLHYGSGASPGAAAVPSVLFPSAIGIAEDGVRLDRERASALLHAAPAGLMPPPNRTAGANALAYDAIGLVFLMISRIEERDYPGNDRYQRFPIEGALLPPVDNHLPAYADDAARDIAAIVTGNPAPAPATRYEIKFTHDVDMLKGYHRPLDPLRLFAGDIVRRRRAPAAAVKQLSTAYLGGEPFWCSRRMMDLAERNNIRNHFYFMGASDDRMDSPYVIRLPRLLRTLTDEIVSRGHVVGYHPGFWTYRDPKEWLRQRTTLESAIGRDVREGRQHVLRYDCAITPGIWSDAGMSFDCTLAYPEAVGFRNGTCRPVHAYDLVARRTLPLIQVSTPVMEFGLFGGKYRDLSDAEAMADALWAHDVCRTHGGTYVVLFHTSIRDPRMWRWFGELLEATAKPG